MTTVPASLFISTYEMPDHLARVCAGLERQTFPNVEIFFCDDGSGPETAKIIQSFSEKFRQRTSIPVQHLWQENRGFRKCEILNKALRQAQGEICIFLDGDCVPHSYFIEDHLSQQQPGYYLAGRRVELGPLLSASLSDADIRAGFFDYPHLRFIQSVLRGDSQYLNRSFRITHPRLRSLFKLNQVVDLKGCNYSVFRRDLETINGFDEDFQGYGREDTDVEIRLQNLGLKIKSLKGMALQFHLWHPRRTFTPSNDTRLEETRHNARIRCVKGMHRVLR